MKFGPDDGLDYYQRRIEKGRPAGRRVGENRKQHRERLRREGDTTACPKCGVPEGALCFMSATEQCGRSRK